MMGAESTISGLLEKRPIPLNKIVKEMAAASRRADVSELSCLKRLSEIRELGGERLAIAALAFLPAWGMEGIDIVVNYAFEGHYKYAALSILAVITEGRCPKAKDVVGLLPDNDALMDYPVPKELSIETLRMIRERLLEIIADPFEKSSFFWSISTLGTIPQTTDKYRSHFGFYADLLVDSHLVINQSMLQRFESLLDSGPQREEELQKFLNEHPVLLDPFVTELRSKHQLGDDFITDYVIRRTNDEYVLVEIENSTDRIFTKDGQFTSPLTKALSQVRDFQAWVADNIAYAQKKLPGIRRPEGLVVIGRTEELDETNAKRLDEENYSRRGHVKIVTFDDLLRQAQAVHHNLVNRPVVLKAKDQRTI